METNLLATGTHNDWDEAAFSIACLSDIDYIALSVLEGALLLLYSRDGVVSMQSVQSLTGDQLSNQSIEAAFFALADARILTRQKRARQGHFFDQFQAEPELIHQIFRDVKLVRRLLTKIQAQTTNLDDNTELLATLPDGLSLSSHIRQQIAPLAASLHRLITEADRAITILNPFFEETGFNRLATALLAAAERGVNIQIITRQLSDSFSVNHNVIKGLYKQGQERGVEGRFSFYEYQHIKEGRIVLTSHAKVIVVDDHTAYIGSANLTEYGMAHHLEIGVTLQGLKVHILQTLLNTVLDSSETREIRMFE